GSLLRFRLRLRSSRFREGHSMEQRTNSLGQAIGFPVDGWSPRPRPPRSAMAGRFCRIEPVDPARHAADLHAANLQDKEGRIWTYLGYGPFDDLAAYRKWMEA